MQGRDLDGNLSDGFEAYYDTDLNVSWLADADYAKNSGFDSDGEMDWNTAMNWVASLNVGGVTGWRLPTLDPTLWFGGWCEWANSGTNCGYNVDTSVSELAHLFHVTLGNKSVLDPMGDVQPVFGMTNSGPFNLGKTYTYWSGVDFRNQNYAWTFNTSGGEQQAAPKVIASYGLNAWAVHPGDVGAIFGAGGASAATPLLPNSILVDGATSFIFDTVTLINGEPGAPDGPPLFFDPVVSTGYEYTLGSGNSFLSVMLPTLGDADGFQIEVFVNGVWVNVASLPDGGSFTFDPGVTRFRVVGIDPTLALDPNDPQAFVTGLNFGSTGGVDLTMTALTTTTAVPEPQAWALALAGLLTLARARRRRTAVH